MKKCWLVAIGFLLFLWGYQAPPKPEAPPATQPEGTVAVLEATEPSGLSFLNKAPAYTENGALGFFSLPVEQPSGIRFLGKEILLFSGSESTVLTLLSREDCRMRAQAVLDCSVSPEDPAVTVTEKGVTYYDSCFGELVFLDPTLNEIRRIPLQRYRPGITQDWKRIYYCTENALRLLDPETGIDRFLKDMNGMNSRLTAIHCGGTVLECRADPNRSLLIDAATGITLAEMPENTLLYTEGDFYFTLRYDGNYPELLSGSRDFGPNVLVPEADQPAIAPVSGSRRLVLTTYSPDYSTSILDCYALESGRCPYRVSIPDEICPTSILADPVGNILWFLSPDSGRLFCWSLEESTTGDFKSYLQSRYTAEHPDLEGIQRCREIAEEISDRHRVEIQIWTDAVSFIPEGYILTPEYQAPWIEIQLKQLDRILSLYPAGFLKKAASETPNGRLKICLVRAITGKSGNTGGLQFWDDQNNACLALAANGLMEKDCLRELFYLIDSRVLCTSAVYDSWEKLNPKDFEYGHPAALGEGADRAFLDDASMLSPREDRSRIMTQAILPGQENCFSSKTLQKKLRTLCLGIRDTFGPPPEAGYLWEQYLSEPLK